MVGEFMKVVLDKKAIRPERAHETDAGIDLFTPTDFVVPAHGFAFVKTGVHMEVPCRCCGHVRSKSGLNRFHGITADGTIDEGYTGEIGVTLHNSGDDDFEFKRGDKVAQVVIEPIYRPNMVLVTNLDDSERSDDGFGSTGR